MPAAFFQAVHVSQHVATKPSTRSSIQPPERTGSNVASIRRCVCDKMSLCQPAADRQIAGRRHTAADGQVTVAPRPASHQPPSVSTTKRRLLPVDHFLRAVTSICIQPHQMRAGNVFRKCSNYGSCSASAASYSEKAGSSVGT